MDNTNSSSKLKSNKADIKYAYWRKDIIEDKAVLSVLIQRGCTITYSKRNRGYIVHSPLGGIIWRV